jgi:hypothetical protein
MSVDNQSLVFKWGSRIAVPEDEELRSLLISEFHDSKYAVQFGMSRIRVAVGRMFWWKSLARDVAKFVSTCVACQQNKARRHKPKTCYNRYLSRRSLGIRCPSILWSSFLRRAGVTLVTVFWLTSSLGWFTLWIAREKCLQRNSLNSTSTMSFVFMV